MSKSRELEMHDPSDKDIHRPEGVDPYPEPKKVEMADRPGSTDGTSPADNSSLQSGGEEDSDGDYVNSVDKMKKELTDEGGVEAWRKGQTQNSDAPRR